jgi:hypothetical protein
MPGKENSIMISRFIATTAIALSLLAASGFAQTAAELFQKGIYTQQTAGDADAAVQIYRQVIASAGTQRGLAAQAQMQIVGALMQKGDLAAAAQEFNTLLTNYSDQKELIASVTARLGGGIRRAAQAAAPPKLTQGTLQGGVYHHATTGMEITLPPGWTVTGDGMSSGGGEGIGLANGDMSATVWLRPDNEAAADIPRLLASDIDYKVKQRTVNGDSGYKVRPETVKPWLPGGQQAMSAVADFNNANGVKMLEYLTFVRTEKTVVFVFGDTLATNIYMYQDSVDRLTSAMRLP